MYPAGELVAQSRGVVVMIFTFLLLLAVFMLYACVFVDEKKNCIYFKK